MAADVFPLFPLFSSCFLCLCLRFSLFPSPFNFFLRTIFALIRNISWSRCIIRPMPTFFDENYNTPPPPSSERRVFLIVAFSKNMKNLPFFHLFYATVYAPITRHPGIYISNSREGIVRMTRGPPEKGPVSSLYKECLENERTRDLGHFVYISTYITSEVAHVGRKPGIFKEKKVEAAVDVNNCLKQIKLSSHSTHAHRILSHHLK